MSFSSRRRNYLLTPHRRDGLIEWYVVFVVRSGVRSCIHPFVQVIVRVYRVWKDRDEALA